MGLIMVMVFEDNWVALSVCEERDEHRVEICARRRMRWANSVLGAPISYNFYFKKKRSNFIPLSVQNVGTAFFTRFGDKGCQFCRA